MQSYRSAPNTGMSHQDAALEMVSRQKPSRDRTSIKIHLGLQEPSISTRSERLSVQARGMLGFLFEFTSLGSKARCRRVTANATGKEARKADEYPRSTMSARI